ncbi:MULTISPECIES: S8 family serine peptidase [Pseudoalteromonas]|uniref:Peptidase S8 n=1 Tax=Pseudoalteromonas amylolytica TaxID=1859457 RepID=A0A1S1MZF4_9GAMM|nr:MULTISPECIES: S8 family serine peptidase [Pseudoalteromonas]OHU84614.1 peptidase S8 [Pseudoalteromonas sp. JW3]OHU92477.1 peptidase S8 [Pseudoalteromonas amylolytica]
MSNMIKKTAIAAAVGSVLLSAAASAQTATQFQKQLTFTPVEASASDKLKQEPAGYMVVLKTTTAADLFAQGTYRHGDARASMAKIEQLQSEVAVELSKFDVDAKVVGKTKVLAPTLIIEASEEAIEKLKNDPRVAKVLPMFDAQLHIEESSDYIEATPIRTGGVATGMGQKVAVLDTGIDYTHAIFGGAGTLEAYQAAQEDPTSVSWPQGQVSGGYDYMRNDADPIENDPSIGPATGAPTSHGTSVSHSVTGIAPDVELYVYSVCGGGCPFAAQAAALEAAMDPNGDGDISDRVDVINMSLGGVFGSTNTGTGTQYLIQKASDLGINMVISAGNDNDIPFIIGGPSTTPNALSVGAMKHPTIEEGVVSATIAGVEAEAVNASWGAGGAYEMNNEIAPLVYPEENQDACVDFGDDVDFTGKAVLIDRGSCYFTEKVIKAQEKGAAFVLIANNVADGPTSMGGSTDQVTIHAVGITLEAGNALKAQLASGEATYSIKNEMFNLAGAVASFTSRGPSMGGLLKPEITAPGKNIMVAATGTQDKLAPATGTSFSGPMTAGAVALVREALPERNAYEIKATLMNTANLNVTTEAVTVNPDAELAPISLVGAGLVDVEKAVNLPVAAWVYEEKFDTNQAALSFGLVKVNGVEEYSKTVTLKNFSSEEKTYNLRTEARYANDEQTGAISWTIPESVTVPAGQTIEFDVKLSIDASKLPEWNLENPLDPAGLAARSPALTLSEFDGALVFDDPSTDGDHDLHLVYHALPKASAGIEVGYELVDGQIRVVLENTSSKEFTPSIEQLVANREAASEEHEGLNLVGASFNVYGGISRCKSDMLFTSSVVLREDIAHLIQGGYEMRLDINEDGEADYAVGQYHDLEAIMGRGLTIIAPMVAGQPAWSMGSYDILFHEAGSNTVTFAGCADAIGLSADDLGKNIAFDIRTGSAAYNGVYSETDQLTGSVAFGASSAQLVNEQGEAIETLAPGAKAYVSANAPFALASADLSGVVLPVTSDVLNNPMPFDAPVLNGVEVSVAENTATGTVIATLAVEDVENTLDVSEFYLKSSTHAGLSVNAAGEIVVANGELLDFEAGNNEAKLMVNAIDVVGNISEPAEIIVNITNVVDTEAEQPVEEVVEPKKSSSSGSLAWLTLLAAPFAALRRRKQK